MKKTISLATLVLMIGLSAGVVGADCPPGQPCIMSGGDSGHKDSYQTIEKNGSDWSAVLSLDPLRPASNISEGIYNESFSQVNGSSKVNFDGVMQLPSPCYHPKINVTKTGEDSYEADIMKKKRDGNLSCTQAITQASYSVEFSAEAPFKLKVNQGDKTENFNHPEYEESDGNEEDSGDGPEESEKEGGGLFSGLFSWFGNLF